MVGSSGVIENFVWGEAAKCLKKKKIPIKHSLMLKFVKEHVKKRETSRYLLTTRKFRITPNYRNKHIASYHISEIGTYRNIVTPAYLLTIFCG